MSVGGGDTSPFISFRFKVVVFATSFVPAVCSGKDNSSKNLIGSERTEMDRNSARRDVSSSSMFMSTNWKRLLEWSALYFWRELRF